MKNATSMLKVGPAPEESLYYKSEEWGKEFMSAQVADWIAINTYKAPEGYFVIGSCHQCGGRIERLLDFRKLADVRAPLRSAVQMQAELIKVMQPIKDEWAVGHALCDKERRTYNVPSEINEFLLHVVSEAGDALRFGNRVHGTLTYMSDGGTYFGVPFYRERRKDSAGSAERIEMAFKKFVGREWMRANKITPTAAIAFSDAWMVDGLDAESVHAVHDSLEHHPDRREVVVVCVTTPEFNTMGSADIIRLNGTENQGPAKLGDMKMEFFGMESRIIDGALATTDQPLPASSYKWLGVRR